jgi:hypothetical protein
MDKKHRVLCEDEEWAIFDVGSFYLSALQIVDTTFGRKYAQDNPLLIAELVKAMVFDAASLRENRE